MKTNKIEIKKKIKNKRYRKIRTDERMQTRDTRQIDIVVHHEASTIVDNHMHVNVIHGVRILVSAHVLPHRENRITFFLIFFFSFSFRTASSMIELSIHIPFNVRFAWK